MRVPVRSLRDLPDSMRTYATARAWLRDVRRRRGLQALRGLAGNAAGSPASPEDVRAVQRLMVLVTGCP